MRVVLDTNVLIAAFISHGICHELFAHCMLNHDVVLSPFILTEFKEKLIKKFKFTECEAEDAAHLVMSRCKIVTIEPLDTPVCRDPDDDSVLATALAGECPCIISGDKDLLDLNSPCGIQIVAPSAFWRFETTFND